MKTADIKALVDQYNDSRAGTATFYPRKKLIAFNGFPGIPVAMGIRKILIALKEHASAHPTPCEATEHGTPYMIGVPEDDSKPFVMCILDMGAARAEHIWHATHHLYMQKLKGYRIEMRQAGKRP